MGKKKKKPAISSLEHTDTQKDAFTGVPHNQISVFLISLILFIIAAWFGWEKLHYGFNFVDEGFHMTESWRLVSGDRLLEDEHYGDPLRLYSVLNALVFKIHPEITLLGFRKLQYIFTLFSLFVFSAAIIKFDKQYWFLPLAFVPFAFNGLLPWGNIPNLNYYTYAHFFLVLHISFFLLGLHQKNVLAKRLLLILSGIAMWGISFSILHTSIIILSPILLFAMLKRGDPQTITFSFIELCFVLAPFFVFWFAFIAIYQETYLLAVISSVQKLLTSSTPDKIKSFVAFKRTIALWCIAISFLHIVTFYFVLKKLRGLFSVIFITILALAMLLAMNKLFLGHKELSGPTWFSSMLIAFLIIFWCGIIKKIFLGRLYAGYEISCLIILVPATMLALVLSLFSFNGIWNFMLSSIPITAAISVYILYKTRLKSESYAIKWINLALFFLPFSYAIIWHAVSIGFFDEPPFSTNVVVIEKGFGRGIVTSTVNHTVYNSIIQAAEMYTDDNDYIIAFPDAPMVHMIAKRKPSLNSSWISFVFTSPDDLNVFLDKEINIMKRKDRTPAMVFILPDSFPQFKESQPDNPLTRYVSENMQLLAQVKNKGQPVMLCLINRKAAINLK